MDPYYTINGPRPDLAVLEVNPPEGYIANKIVPPVFVAEKSGPVYYHVPVADESAQTNRTPLNAPTGTAIANASTSYMCTELIKRGEISPDEAKAMGGIAKADMVGTKFAKRCVMNAVESLVATATVGRTADDTFDAGSFLAQVQAALDSTRAYYGRSTLLGATITLKRVVQALLSDESAGSVLSRLVSGISPTVAATGLNFQSWMNGLALYLGVDQVLAGDSAIWNAGENANKVAIGKFDDGSEELVHKYEPVFARQFVFLPDGQSPWYVETIADRDTKSNKYDAVIWQNIVTLNAGAVYVLGGVPN